jgi:hypothetical protein
MVVKYDLNKPSEFKLIKTASAAQISTRDGASRSCVPTSPWQGSLGVAQTVGLGYD